MASERSLESYRNQQKPTGRHTCVPGPVLASASGFGPQAWCRPLGLWLHLQAPGPA